MLRVLWPTWKPQRFTFTAVPKGTRFLVKESSTDGAGGGIVFPDVFKHGGMLDVSRERDSVLATLPLQNDIFGEFHAIPPLSPWMQKPNRRGSRSGTVRRSRAVIVQPSAAMADSTASRFVIGRARICKCLRCPAAYNEITTHLGKPLLIVFYVQKQSPPELLHLHEKHGRSILTNMPDNDDARETESKRFILSQAKRAIDLRSKDREFHGLEREFLYHQAEMLVAYEKSKDIKHPRDVGTAREEILRKFLTEGGYLPKRYGVSQRSARVASASGHISNEIDILLYDPLDSLCLMNRENVYEVLPVESVYGVIQVKSRLNKNEIKDGLENLASFKRLDRIEDGSLRILDGREERGFGILFAYDSDLEWHDIIHEIEEFAKQHPNRVWCNGVFILSKGIMLYGEGNSGKSKNSDLEKIQKLQMFGFPDRHNLCLYQFQNTLLSLLRSTKIQPAGYDAYFRLPLIVDDFSYEFSFGSIAECATCEKHGDYQRKIGADQLAKLIDWCKKAEPINWIRATDIAYGRPGNNEEAYARQPGDVRIYNPEKLPLSEILVHKTSKALAFDSILCAGMTIFIPYFYSEKEGVIGGCPKCKA